MLVGSILAVRGRDVLAMGALYAATGVLHWLCRRPFFLISYDPAAAFGAGYRVRAWDFLFYATFGVVVASSVRVAGVLLVFSYLVAPALAATALGGSFARPPLLGWSFGVAASVVGVAASAAFDLPTGAAVVCAFGAALLLLAAARALRRAPAGRAAPRAEVTRRARHAEKSSGLTRSSHRATSPTGSAPGGPGTGSAWARASAVA